MKTNTTLMRKAECLILHVLKIHLRRVENREMVSNTLQMKYILQRDTKSLDGVSLPERLCLLMLQWFFREVVANDLLIFNPDFLFTPTSIFKTSALEENLAFLFQFRFWLTGAGGGSTPGKLRALAGFSSPLFIFSKTYSTNVYSAPEFY